MRWLFLFLLLFVALFTGAQGNQPPDTLDVMPASVEPWPEADALFQKDPHWHGGDDAHSIDLGKGRVLWLFGDSFVATTPVGTRRESTLVRNSIAIQQGYDPSTASIRFYWNIRNGLPASFFREADSVWYWPGHGILLKNTLLIFLMKVKRTNKDIGFAVTGWEAVAINNPEKDPSEWRLRWLGAPSNNFGVIAGSASVVRVGQYVYAFSVREPGNHDVFIARWPVMQAEKGNLKEPFWWLGAARGWVSQSRLRQTPKVLFAGGQTEFTVHYDGRQKQWMQVQTEGFGVADMALRQASQLTGPWSALQKFYRPTDITQKDAFMYAGKAHPELRGADQVFTYVVNSLDFDQMLNDSSLYYPRFLRARYPHSDNK